MIADFGLAHFQSYTNKFKSTRPRKLFGTPTYRPPECDLNDERISNSWDVWSLGCVWLEFVTWYLLGSEGVLADFPKARTQTVYPGQRQGTEDGCFFTLQGQEGDGSPMQSNLKPSVRNVSNKPTTNRSSVLPAPLLCCSAFDFINLLRRSTSGSFVSTHIVPNSLVISSI